MTSVEEHKNTVAELLADINEKIRAGILVRRQKLVGFAASEASTNMFELFLHKKNLITPGFNVNHKYFASFKRANDVFVQDFERKAQIIEMLVIQEGFRDKLCYGKSKSDEMVNEAVKNLFELKTELEELIGEKL